MTYNDRLIVRRRRKGEEDPVLGIVS